MSSQSCHLHCLLAHCRAQRPRHATLRREESLRETVHIVRRVFLSSFLLFLLTHDTAGSGRRMTFVEVHVHHQVSPDAMVRVHVSLKHHAPAHAACRLERPSTASPHPSFRVFRAAQTDFVLRLLVSWLIWLSNHVSVCPTRALIVVSLCSSPSCEPYA